MRIAIATLADALLVHPGDGRMCHNPKIYKPGGVFVLYYNTTDLSNRRLHGKHPCRQIGYPVSTSVYGPWKRLDEPLPIGEYNNNPAPYFHKDGSVLLAHPVLRRSSLASRNTDANESHCRIKPGRHSHATKVHPVGDIVHHGHAVPAYMVLRLLACGIHSE